jgi:hypothetical protein
MGSKWLRRSPAPHITNAVIVRAGGRSSIPEKFAIDRDAAAYWVARSSRAMTAVFVSFIRVSPHAGIELAMTLMDRSPRSRDAIRPSFVHNCLAHSKSEGAGNAGCALHPRSRVQKAEEERTRACRFSGGTPTFPAQWLYGLLRALPGDQDLFVTVAPWMMAGPTPGWAGFASAGLDANHEASGPHDFAVREQHHSSARRPVAHGPKSPPCNPITRLMLPRPPHPAPRL